MMDYRQQGQGQFFYPGYPGGGNTDRRLDRLERQYRELERRVERLERRLGYGGGFGGGFGGGYGSGHHGRPDYEMYY